MPNTKRVPKKAAKAPPEDLPKWVSETPDEIEYSLEVTDFEAAHDQQLQKILVTRNEYIALKEKLAKMRGYAVAEVANA